MTLIYFMSLVVGQGITLRDSARLKELFSEENVGAMGKFVARIVVLTLAIEALGAYFIHGLEDRRCHRSKQLLARRNRHIRNLQP